MTAYIDIDGTICDSPDTRDYSKSTPIAKNIHRANEMFRAGVRIVYWTARGAKTGIDWKVLTEKQLAEWGVLYHELRFGKPDFDVFIDDKALNARDWEAPRTEWKHAELLSES